LGLGISFAPSLPGAEGLGLRGAEEAVLLQKKSSTFLSPPSLCKGNVVYREMYADNCMYISSLNPSTKEQPKFFHSELAFTQS